jgi:regulator of protease activity HflC (stomatin/prohibitin superfamily)
MSELPVPILIVIAIVVLYLIHSIKILRDYERAVISGLAVRCRYRRGRIMLVFRPLIKWYISLRQDVLEIPAQDVITRDNVTLKVNAVVALYVVDPNAAAIKVANYVCRHRSLRNHCGRSW